MARRRRVNSTIARALFGAFAVTFAQSIVRADLIYFRKGGEAQVPATAEDSRLLVAMPDGSVELSCENVRKLVPGFWPAAEWGERRRQAIAGGIDARFANAWWALENGLTAQATAEVRELNAVDRNHAPSARMVSVLARLERPCSDPDYDTFQKSLGVETKVARGPHVLLLHQHSDDEANERIALLEQVVTSYYLAFAAEGMELSVPRRRLVSAWFAQKRDYLAFLHAQDADAFVSTRGYYHPTWNAVVAFDSRSTDQQRTGREQQAARREELRRFRDKVDEAPARSRIRIQLGGEPQRVVGCTEARAVIARLEGEVTCELLLLDLDRRSIDLGTAAHEMIHQLVIESGLVRRHDTFPHWMHEGLAAQFEVIRGGRWAGISRAHDLRLPDWRGIQEPIRLERLVRDAGFGRGYQRELYAQAWALVYYLRTQRSRDFLTFIDLLRPSEAIQDTQPATGDRIVGAFQRAFGSDLDRVDKDWRAFMMTVHTPLEQNAPPAAPARSSTGSASRRKS
jgi:Protein of unknown function (DUF1570)